jgi:hypothetical protein
MARGLLGPVCMKLFAGSAVVLLSLCAPALADSAPPPRAGPPASINIHFVVRTGAAARTHDVIVTADHRCAQASEKVSDHEDEIMVCASGEAQLDIDWRTRSGSSEYRSKASLVVERGKTAELGSGTGPRLAVTIQ